MSFEEEKSYRSREKMFHAALLGGTFVAAIWLLGPVGFLLWLPLGAWYLSRHLVSQVEEGVDDLRWKKYGEKGGGLSCFRRPRSSSFLRQLGDLSSRRE